MYVIYCVLYIHTHTATHTRTHACVCMYVCICMYITCIYYMHIVISQKVQKEERSTEEYQGPSWREASQLIDTSAWFLNQVNSGPNQHL
jgi:hypothetical protein